MKKYLPVIIIIILISTAFVFLKNSKSPGKLYGEYIAEGPVYAKFVQIKPEHIQNFNYKDITIETLGYKEIRVYAQLFKEDYKSKPLQSEGILNIRLSHEMSGLGTPYKENIYKNKFTSYIDGFAIENIYGRKTKIAVDADNIPEGNYTLSLSYYLLP